MGSPHKCRFCGSVADKRIIWAGGRAYQPVCSAHVKKGKATIQRENGKWAEIVAVKTVKNMSEALSALLFGAQNWMSTTSSEEGMTTTANVPTLPVPIGPGNDRKFPDCPADGKRRKLRKKKRLSRGVRTMLRR